MIHILEYITQHYTLFLGGIFLILLAIIGYYADKTNFGQGKKSEIKENNNTDDVDINNVGILDAVNHNTEEVLKDSEINNQNINQENSSIISSDSVKKNDNDSLTESNSINNNSIEIQQSFQDNSSLSTSEQILKSNSNSEDLFDSKIFEELTVPVASIINSKSDDREAKEEAFNKFSDEFNSILPKKELLNEDLLNDIDDLELGKTQKINLNIVPDLDDIDLPKIKNLASEERDIWKF